MRQLIYVFLLPRRVECKGVIHSSLWKKKSNFWNLMIQPPRNSYETQIGWSIYVFLLSQRKEHNDKVHYTFKKVRNTILSWLSLFLQKIMRRAIFLIFVCVFLVSSSNSLPGHICRSTQRMNLSQEMKNMNLIRRCFSFGGELFTAEMWHIFFEWEKNI